MLQTEPKRRLLVLPLVARKLRVPTKWLQAEAEANRIPHLKAGKVILAEVEAVEAALLERVRKGDEDAR
jgi:hypothetical protein